MKTREDSSSDEIPYSAIILVIEFGAFSNHAEVAVRDAQRASPVGNVAYGGSQHSDRRKSIGRGRKYRNIVRTGLARAYNLATVRHTKAQWFSRRMGAVRLTWHDSVQHLPRDLIENLGLVQGSNQLRSILRNSKSTTDNGSHEQ